jgi:hypothetical protein
MIGLHSPVGWKIGTLAVAGTFNENFNKMRVLRFIFTRSPRWLIALLLTLAPIQADDVILTADF